MLRTVMAGKMFTRQAELANDDGYNHEERIEIEEVDVEETSKMLARGKKKHFYPKADILILRQVVADRPFEAAHGTTEEAWSVLAKKLEAAGLTAEARSIRERFALLIRRFRANEMESLRSSGIEEEYEEREILLTQLVELMDSKKRLKVEKRAEDTERAVMANKLRDDAMLNMREKTLRRDDSHDEGKVVAPTKKRMLTTLLADRSERREKEMELEKARLQNEAKKLELKDKKLELKKQELDSQTQMQKMQMQLFTAICSKLTTPAPVTETSSAVDDV